MQSRLIFSRFLQSRHKHRVLSSCSSNSSNSSNYNWSCCTYVCVLCGVMTTTMMMLMTRQEKCFDPNGIELEARRAAAAAARTWESEWHSAANKLICHCCCLFIHIFRFYLFCSLKFLHKFKPNMIRLLMRATENFAWPQNHTYHTLAVSHTQCTMWSDIEIPYRKLLCSLRYIHCWDFVFAWVPKHKKCSLFLYACSLSRSLLDITVWLSTRSCSHCCTRSLSRVICCYIWISCGSLCTRLRNNF